MVDGGLTGERAATEALVAADLDRPDREGRRLGDRHTAFGVDPAGVVGAGTRFRRLHGYVELHVEQGPLTAIGGGERLLVTFACQANHAGTRPMDDRRDAVVAAAEAVPAVRREGCVVHPYTGFEVAFGVPPAGQPGMIFVPSRGGAATVRRRGPSSNTSSPASSSSALPCSAWTGPPIQGLGAVLPGRSVATR